MSDKPVLEQAQQLTVEQQLEQLRDMVADILHSQAEHSKEIKSLATNLGITNHELRVTNHSLVEVRHLLANLGNLAAPTTNGTREDRESRETVPDIRASLSDSLDDPNG